MIRREIDVKRAPTKSQIKMLEAAERHPICFDEDCPELADDDLVKFKKITDTKKEPPFYQCHLIKQKSRNELFLRN